MARDISRRYEALSSEIRVLILAIITSSNGAKWTEIREILEKILGKRINPNIISFHIRKLIDASLVKKDNDVYRAKISGETDGELNKLIEEINKIYVYTLKQDIIKNIVLNESKNLGIEVEKIILFGSRARGDYKEDSDWDILIITRKELDREMLKSMYLRIKRKLIDRGIPNDIVILSRELYMKKRRFVGNIAYEASLEGVEIKI
jgi:predicted nucleotidyltransferase